MGSLKKLKRIAQVISNEGAGGLLDLYRARDRRIVLSADYRRWLANNGGPDAMANAENLARLERRPLISVVMPVYNVDEIWLRKCIDSVIAQIYPNWELCIADDASTRPHIRPTLEEYSTADSRIKVVFRSDNGHISAASNSALEIATGEFSVLLDHDDELAPDALFWVARELNEHPNASMIYSDEDLINEKGERSEPKFKPDLSRDLLYSMNLVTHLSAYRTELLREIGGFRLGLEGSQDYDLALRVIERIPVSAIRHIPRILYHWRTISTSVAGNAGAKPYAFEMARVAIRSHFERTGVAGEVLPTVFELNRVKYELPTRLPLVSVIVDGLTSPETRSLTKYPEIEWIGAGPGGTFADRLNIAAASARGEVICFLDGDLLALANDWLCEMLSFALQPSIGAVGAKLLRPNGVIDQTGIILGGSKIVRKAHSGLPRRHIGDLFRAALVGNYSAVSRRCMMVRRDVFEGSGGFDEANLPEHLFDVDLCLRLGERDMRIVYTPYAELISASQLFETEPSPAEIKYFRSRWTIALGRDPFYNPNFSSEGETFRYRS